MFKRAIVRRPGATFAQGLTTAGLGAPDFNTALAQHAAYCDALRACGLELTVLEADPEHPDSVFVEDVAILTAGCAILARPGAPTRRGEAARMRPTLERFFDRVEAIQPPGTLDGGDVCEAGEHYFIGISHRTNADGARQLAALLQRAGCTSSFVDVRAVREVLHLKSGIAYLGDGRLVVIDALRGCDALGGYELMRVDPRENYAANCVRVNDYVLLPEGYPAMRASLEAAGYRVLALDVSEYRKMDGGLSCISLRF